MSGRGADDVSACTLCTALRIMSRNETDEPVQRAFTAFAIMLIHSRPDEEFVVAAGGSGNERILNGDTFQDFMNCSVVLSFLLLKMKFF